MRTVVSVSSQSLEKFSWNDLLRASDSTDGRVIRMKKILRLAMEHELTKRQHTCITMRYFDDLSVKEIAVRMNLKPTTVYKHLQKAKNALKKCSLYF